MITLSKDNASDIEYDIQATLGYEGHQKVCGYKRLGNILLRVKNHTPDWDYFRDDIEDGITAIINITVGDYNNSDYRRNKGQLDALQSEYPDIYIANYIISEGDDAESIIESIRTIINEKS